jgi:hypothetical protein
LVLLGSWEFVEEVRVEVLCVGREVVLAAVGALKRWVLLVDVFEMGLELIRMKCRLIVWSSWRTFESGSLIGLDQVLLT